MGKSTKAVVQETLDAGRVQVQACLFPNEYLQLETKKLPMVLGA